MSHAMYINPSSAMNKEALCVIAALGRKHFKDWYQTSQIYSTILLHIVKFYVGKAT